MYILSGYLHSLFVHVFCIRAMIWILGVILSIVYSPVSISHLRVSLLILWNKKKCKGGKRRTTDTPFEYWWLDFTSKRRKKVIGSPGIFVIFFFLLLIFFVLVCFNILKAQKRISSRGEQKRFWMGLGKFVWGERYHHHLAFGTRTLAADVCCETREDIYRRRLPPTVPNPLDIMLSIYPGGQQRDFWLPTFSFLPEDKKCPASSNRADH